jgi:uncharacterized repeat protein (TIGR02543 family)
MKGGTFMNTRFTKLSVTGVVLSVVAAGMVMLAGCTSNNSGGSPAGIAQYTLHLKSEPAGSGIFSVDSGTVFDDGTVCTLTVSPTPPAGRFVFLGWEGDTAGTTTTGEAVTVVMDGDRTLTAKFERRYSVTVLLDPADATNGVNITRQPSADSILFYPAESTVKLAATVVRDSAYRFLGWVVNDSIIGTLPVISCTVNSDTTVTAKFQRKYRIFVTIDPSGGSNDVEFDPPGPLYDIGDTVTLKAKPNANFEYWGKPDGSLFYEDDPAASINSELKLIIGNTNVNLIAKFSSL